MSRGEIMIIYINARGNKFYRLPHTAQRGEIRENPNCCKHCEANAVLEFPWRPGVWDALSFDDRGMGKVHYPGMEGDPTLTSKPASGEDILRINAYLDGRDDYYTRLYIKAVKEGR